MASWVTPAHRAEPVVQGQRGQPGRQVQPERQGQLGQQVRPDQLVQTVQSPGLPDPQALPVRLDRLARTAQ